MSNHDIPKDMEAMVRKLRSGQPITRTDRAFICGFMRAAQMFRKALDAIEADVEED